MTNRLHGAPSAQWLRVISMRSSLNSGCVTSGWLRRMLWGSGGRTSKSWGLGTSSGPKVAVLAKRASRNSAVSSCVATAAASHVDASKALAR